MEDRTPEIDANFIRFPQVLQLTAIESRLRYGAGSAISLAISRVTVLSDKEEEEEEEDLMAKSFSQTGENRNASATIANSSVTALVTRLRRPARTNKTKSTNARWIIDSGASHHMCNCHSAFHSIEQLGKPIKVQMGDGSFLLAIGSGLITIQLGPHCLKLTALYIPKLKYCLLSVSRLSSTYQVSFRDDICYLNPRSGENRIPVVLGLLVDGLYELHARPTSTDHKWHNENGGTTLLSRIPSTASLPLMLWHQRFAHLSFDTLKIILPPSSYNSTSTPEGLCDICVKAKHQRKIARVPVERTTQPFQLVHSDLCGPILPESVSGFRYFIVYIDDFSRMAWVYFLRTKSAVEVVTVFQEFKASTERQFPDSPIKRFRCDNGRGEYDNNLFRGILRVSGIAFEPSPPYTQHKNGVSERMIRTLVTKARSMLLDAKFEDQFWAEAINTSAYLQNRSPSRPIQNQTPYELLHSRKPEIGHLRRFGCAAYKLIPKEQRRGKFSERARECGFLGYVHDTAKIWRLWDPVGKRVVQASDVKFDELRVVGTYMGEQRDTENGILKSCLPEEIDDEDRHDEINNSAYGSVPIHNSSDALFYGDKSGTHAQGRRDEIPQVVQGVLTDKIPIVEEDGATETITEMAQDKAPDSEEVAEFPLRRSARIRLKPVGLVTGIPDLGIRPMNTMDEEEPTSYREALNQSSSTCWQDAMRDEYQSLERNNTWSYVSQEEVPAGMKVIGCRWVFRKKVNPDMTTRYKARLVIKGYEQIPGVDFGDTYAPVARLVSLRLLLAIAASQRWEIHHMDVVTAFLNPPIDHVVYMELPEGISWLDPGVRKLRLPCCQLKKALYGLKQAPRLWYKHIDAFLKSIEFSQSANDPNLYTHTTPPSAMPDILILLYVDDLLITAHDIQRVIEVKGLLKEKYRMNDLGRVQQFLGLQISQSPAYTILLHQSRFISVILKRFEMDLCNGVQTPMECGLKLLPASTSDSIITPSTYQSLIGSLMYLVVSTRPDIAFAVATLSKFNAKPTALHFSAAKRLLRYLKQTQDLALEYGAQRPIRTINHYLLPTSGLHGFSDSDFAGDTEDRKSTSGYVFCLAGAAVSWRAKKQKLVALSTVEAEYIGYSEAAREGIWLQRLLSEMTGEVPSPISIFCDNQGAIEITKNPKFHERTKHIDIKYHFIRSAYEEDKIDLQYIPTTEQSADIMTKPLPPHSHWKHVYELGLKNMQVG